VNLSVGRLSHPVAMAKKKTKKQSAKATPAEVIKEMAKPRVVSSAREDVHILGTKF